MHAVKKFLFSAILLSSVLALSPLKVQAADIEVRRPNKILCSDIPENDLHVGDLIFARIDNFLYRRVARVSGGWTSHVGIVLKDDDGRWVVFQSRPVYSQKTPFCAFVKHYSKTRIAIARYKQPGEFFPDEQRRLLAAAKKRLHVRYDLHFNLEARKTTFCSKFVDEIYFEALGIHIGKVEDFGDLLKNVENSPYLKGDMKFWNRWFWGKIPWDQKTLTPNTQLNDPNFHVWFDSEEKDSTD
jgi:hypothetical protein